MDRRGFIITAGAAAGTTLAAMTRAKAAKARAIGPNDRITVAVVGVRGRGSSLLLTFAAQKDVDVKYVCDLDPRVLASRVEGAAKQGKRPTGIKDFRRALDDDSVDALVLGTPDHWHALPTIMACQAGKDVYVEKPDGHNILEGQTMVEAAKKYKRVVQLGTQSRSGVMHNNAMKYLAKGSIGTVRFAKAWESSRQGSIGHPKDTAPPEGVDYDFWLGPAPKRAFNPRRFHGSWRWFFDYGTGDLGNDGVHRLDIARWALETAVAAKGEKLPAYPRKVSALGGKYYFDDDQEWPDTLMVTYDYPGYVMTYEMRIWSAYPLHGESEGAAVYGDQGYVVIGNRRWRAFDGRGKLIHEEAGSYSNPGHARDFLDCMRSRKRPVADLETVGHPSSMLCHLGNAAWRLGRTVEFDAKTHRFVGDEQANDLLTRSEYRKPWLLPKIEQL